MDIMEHIANMELRLRSAGFNAPIEYGSLKAVCFESAELLSEIHAACRFETHLVEMAECLADAIKHVEGAYGPNDPLARDITREWRNALKAEQATLRAELALLDAEATSC